MALAPTRATTSTRHTNGDSVPFASIGLSLSVASLHAGVE